MKLSVIFVLIQIYLANAVYFSMRNIRMTIPSDRGKFPPGNHALVTLYAHSNSSGLRYSLNNALTDKYLQIYPTTGDVLFTEKFFQKSNISDLHISTSLTVSDSINQHDRTSLEINVFPLDPLDCDYILRDLCFWKSAEYSIYENDDNDVFSSSSSTLIGSLASPYLAEMCPDFKINYSLEDDFQEFGLIKSSESDRSWSIASIKRLNRDLNIKRKSLNVTCTVESSQGVIREVRELIRVQILDLNDNLPEAQQGEFHIGLPSNVVYKDQKVEHDDLIFRDKDTPAVNNHSVSILGDDLDVLKAKCKSYENDMHGEPQTALHCKLIFTKNMQIMNSTYSVTLQINDTTLINGKKDNKNGSRITSVVKVPIHLHFNNDSGYHPITLKKHFYRSLLLYPSREVKVFRTAGPLARITQPTPNHSASNFTTQNTVKDIFRVTNKAGIVFVHDIAELRQSQEYFNLNISWIRNKTIEFDEIVVRIVDESRKTCTHMNSSINDWFSCSEFGNPSLCSSDESCALSTGGSSSVERRNGPERCIWRGDENPGNETTHLYSTCTPDVKTCPDGICDDLELLHYKICPQDCAEQITFPTRRNLKTSRGIDKASGVCVCDDRGACTCGPIKKINKNKTNKPKLSRTQPNVSKHVGNFTTKILGIEITKCGTTCVLGIVAGSLFLIGAVALVVICWRLDSVHKAVRGKIPEENQDLSAPLSDYVDRSLPEPINFNMTTPLTIFNSPSDRLRINKYKPDLKWEFPRNQLTIEQTLGEGEFGRVLRAKALNIAGQTGYTTVAVKTLKEDARESELNDLLSEYQLLKEVSHPNVIRLLGVCTTPGGPVYLIIEFAEYGSLRNYLRRSRHLKSELGRLPSSIDPDESEIHYDEPNVSIKVTSKEILSFAWQICKGMAYLSDIKLVHRDLAARNVLLASNKICKISDFGLTRDIYEDDAYFKRSKGRVPVKWMAPESLSDHIYTNKSDIWSFGILVWELVTLGATPYPGIAVQNLFHLLRQGYRMERPDNCSSTLYNIMISCWNINSEERPTFQELSSIWEKMLLDGVEYLDLTNNAIHNRSYFCSPFEENLDIDKSPVQTNPSVNYLNKSQSYVKCGAAEKLSPENNIFQHSDSNQNNVTTQGYETPVKMIPKEALTPTNESPQYYTDMAVKKI